MNAAVVMRLARGRLSLRVEHRTLVVTLLLALALAASALTSLSLGSQATSPGAVLEALLYPARSDIALIVHEIRLPRVVLAVLVGACLGWPACCCRGWCAIPWRHPM